MQRHGRTSCLVSSKVVAHGGWRQGFGFLFAAEIAFSASASYRGRNQRQANGEILRMVCGSAATLEHKRHLSLSPSALISTPVCLLPLRGGEDELCTRRAGAAQETGRGGILPATSLLHHWLNSTALPHLHYQDTKHRHSSAWTPRALPLSLCMRTPAI